MKFWIMVGLFLLTMYCIIEASKRKMEWMAYWIGLCMSISLAAFCAGTGYKTGATAVSKGWVSQREDGKFYVTEKDPSLKQYMETPVV